jgi:hypothetical protein
MLLVRRGPKVVWLVERPLGGGPAWPSNIARLRARKSDKKRESKKRFHNAVAFSHKIACVQRKAKIYPVGLFCDTGGLMMKSKLWRSTQP